MFLLDYLVKRKIPKQVFDFQDIVLHVTDTPDIVFGYLARLIRLIKPSLVIHTGDLVDNIKLEMSRSQVDLYEKKLKSLFKIIDPVPSVYYCVGNHDDEGLMKRYTDHHVVTEGLVEFDDYKFAISHWYKKCSSFQADFYLFGHSLDQDSQMEDGILNGLNAIHIIDGKTGQVVCLPYPKDTDYFRLKRIRLSM